MTQFKAACWVRRCKLALGHSLHQRMHLAMPKDQAGKFALSSWLPDGTGAKNWPWSTRRTSTYDVALPDDCADDEYLGQLEHWLPLLFERHQPELVFLQAGVDALKQDKFGRWARVSMYGLLLHHTGVLQQRFGTLGDCQPEPVCASLAGGLFQGMTNDRSEAGHVW